jgi:hypothetical protein
MAKWWPSIIMFFLPAQCKRNKCNFNWFWLINSNMPAGRSCEESLFYEEPLTARQKNLKPLLNEWKFFMVYIAFLKTIFSLVHWIQLDMWICCFAIAGAGPGMRSVLLQLQVWCSCITQRKRASSALLNMISVAGRTMWRVTLWGAIDSKTEELETIAQWMEILYGIHCIPQNNLFFGSLDSVW